MDDPAWEQRVNQKKQTPLSILIYAFYAEGKSRYDRGGECAVTTICVYERYGLSLFRVKRAVPLTDSGVVRYNTHGYLYPFIDVQ